jgi:GNAT superfamily N-acetyltransferase
MGTVVDSYFPPDAAAVAALVLDIQNNEFGIAITLADQPDLADVQGWYLRGAGGFWVARDGDAIVGTIGLLDYGAGEGALRKMFVRRDRRGKEHGVASQLFERLLEHARDRGITRIVLGTRPEMRVAHRFYERRGFGRIDEAALPPSFPRMKVDSVFYALDVARVPLTRARA